MRSLVTFFALFVTLVCTSNAAFAASGTALGVDPDAQLEDKAGKKTLVVGTDVFIGDRVITDARGLVQIKFSDQTELVVGPRSALVIEDYLLRENGSGGKFAVNALAGTFRFVTGGAPKDRYLISTPTGTIGVRGTAFDFSIGGSLNPGSGPGTTVLVFNGAVILCNLAQKCVVIDEMCELGEATVSDALVIGSADEITGAARDVLRAKFPYAVSDAELLRDFRIADSRRCTNRPVSVTPQDPVTKSGQPPRQDNR